LTWDVNGFRQRFFPEGQITMINTKQVTGRREVRYETMEELLDEAKRLTGTQVRRLGNWSPGQVYEHLARSFDGSIDGFDMSMPAPVRWLMSLLMKKKMLYRSIPAGFKSTPKFIAGETSDEAGLANLEKAIERQKSESSRVMHPGFGNLTREEWEAFHLRHAEMHMSFLEPEE
jgi:hypothetical protein